MLAAVLPPVPAALVGQWAGSFQEFSGEGLLNDHGAFALTLRRARADAGTFTVPGSQCGTTRLVYVGAKQANGALWQRFSEHSRGSCTLAPFAYLRTLDHGSRLLYIEPDVGDGGSLVAAPRLVAHLHRR